MACSAAAAQLLCLAMVSFSCFFFVSSASSTPCTISLAEASPSASGYLPVNQSSGSNMFFVYYEALQVANLTSPDEHRSADSKVNGTDDTPIVLWLQGGPGCSGMIGNFFELGPWRVGEDQCLYRNPAPWNRIFGLLFLDNPVGTGFSKAPRNEDIPTDQDGVAADVYIALQSFFDQFPAFRKRPFYVTGESYAGKYVPSVASYILRKQKGQGGSSRKFRLDGIAIGNGLTHPIAQIKDHAPTAYHMGLIDEHEKKAIDAIAADVVASTMAENWTDAYWSRIELLDYISNATGLETLYDVRKTTDYMVTANGTDYLTPFMNKPEIQTTLLKAELGLWEECSDQVSQQMALDVPKSTKHLVEFVLNESLPVLLYQGQFDLKDGVSSNEAWIRLLNWQPIRSFLTAEKKVWKEEGITAGYVRSFSSLTHVVVSNAGHLVPADQPYFSQRMIEGWITGGGIA